MKPRLWYVVQIFHMSHSVSIGASTIYSTTHTQRHTYTHACIIRKNLTIAKCIFERNTHTSEVQCTCICLNSFSPFRYPMATQSPGSRQFSSSWSLGASPLDSLNRWRTCKPWLGRYPGAMKGEGCGVSLNQSLKHPEPKKVDPKHQGRPRQLGSIGHVHTCSYSLNTPTTGQWGPFQARNFIVLILILISFLAVMATEKQGMEPGIAWYRL